PAAVPPLALPDALPISLRPVRRTKAPIGCTGDVRGLSAGFRPRHVELLTAPPAGHAARPSRERLPLTTARTDGVAIVAAFREARSEEHTSELQSRGHLV